MCDEMNWKNKIVKIKSLLNIWLLRRLTIHGRVSVINSLMLSRFWYALFVTALPEWAYIEIKRLCLNFIWKNRCHLVKYNCIVDDKSRGGLNVADIKCKIYAFRLKFLGRLLDDEYEVLWKYTFKYFVSSIYDMKLCHNVFYTVIPNCELKKLPVVYQEFFQALNCIREKIEFPLSVENIYDQPLFVNPNIVLNNRTIVWHDFIGAGIVCLKDICFEVKTGFLPDHAIVEMIQVIYEDVNVQYVVDRYRNLLNVIPVEWKNTVNTDIHRISIPRTIDISIICKNVHYDLKLCSTKTLYTIMLENIVEEPVGIELWKSEFDVSSEAFSKIWEHVNMYWKPSNLVELDFKVLHNCIFTNVKLQKIGLVDDNICKVCCSEKEDILHIFMNCDKLEDFHNYLSSLLVRIFENCDSDKISLVGMIPNCELKKLPVVYQEFFQALNCIREKIEFPLSVENIYDQPLFVNPNIVLNNRTIVWHDFIGAGIVCLKDICFEVKTGFLPDHAIVEMIQVIYEDVNVQYVVDRYRNLLNVIPVEWKTQ
ncbi:unnamed protein product [Mytilus coruscus]|uniref:Uncharacterized protein n=1 Tax=Mytilus coruscus TaxID=42192 RepID=A0A6J8DIC5_MYTCO|nr:unnamed protein product [Mytilus coruscus]